MKEKEIVLKLYHNVSMGVVGIESIEDKIESRSLAKIILKEKESYNKLKSELAPFCKQYDVLDKELSTFVKVNSDLMANMKTILDHTDSHIAKMMMEGTNKGLIELEKILNHYDGQDEKLIQMIEKIIEEEKQNYEELKIFL